MRIAKIQTRSWTRYCGKTASRMKAMSATPVTP